MFSAINSAISKTLVSPSFITFTPSVIIVLQNGHQVAIISGSRDRASSVRLRLIS